MAIDFAKLLYEQFQIKYGPKNSYSPYPRQWKVNGIKNKSNIVPVSLGLRRGYNNKWWIYIEEGGITGYESSELEGLRFHNRDWYACAGGMGYDSLRIPLFQLKKVIPEMINYINGVLDATKKSS